MNTPLNKAEGDSLRDQMTDELALPLFDRQWEAMKRGERISPEIWQELHPDGVEGLGELRLLDALFEAARVVNEDSQVAAQAKGSIDPPDNEGSNPFIDDTIDADSTVSFDVQAAAKAAGERVRPVGRTIKIPGYEVQGVLGRGGMGVVYRARQIRADRIVALKVMINIDRARPEEIERFAVEAQASARLQHTGIVQVFEVGQAGNVPYFTQEYVEGGTLATRISKQLLSREEAAELMLELTKAVAYAHSRGIIHRDLKPSNILMAEGNKPKIADFGLARRMEDQSHLTKDGTIIGTPTYMAPEQAYGSVHEIGPLSDVYTLGAILYELLVGRPPFKGANVWEVVEQVRRAEPTPPSEIERNVPRDLETICLKCLQKDPTKRYASAQHLADDIQRYLKNEPILARPIGQWERLVRLCLRHPREARLVGMVAALIIGIAIVSTWSAVLIARQRDQIAAEKKVSDERLKRWRSTIFTAVNRLPQFIENNPFSAGITQEISSMNEELLQSDTEGSSDDPAAEASRQAGLVGIAIRRGDVARTQAPNKLVDAIKWKESMEAARQEYSRANEIAQKIYQTKAGDRAKAAGNLANTLNKLASLMQVMNDGDPIANHGDPTETEKKAIALRQEAADMVQAEDSKGKRLANLGREWTNLVELELNRCKKLAGQEQVTSALKLIETTREAIRRTTEGLQAMKEGEEGRHNAQRDIAIAYLNLAEAGKLAMQVETVKEGYEQAIDGFRKVSAAEPDRKVHNFNLCTAASNYGDYLLVKLQDPVAARKQYVINMQEVLALKQDKQLATLEMERWSMGYYRLGLAAAAQNDLAQVKRYFERSALIQDVNLRQLAERPESKANPDLLLDSQINLMLTQAWAGQVDPAISTARSLVARFTKDADAMKHKRAAISLARSAFALAIASQFLPEANRADLQQESLSVLRKAFQAGYRDQAYLTEDPDVKPMREIEGFAELVKELANVDSK